MEGRKHTENKGFGPRGGSQLMELGAAPAAQQPAAGVGTHLASLGVKPEPLRNIPPPPFACVMAWRHKRRPSGGGVDFMV
ncbi:hypothetical protein ACFLV7_09905 [Chloroflexota bacterium]